VASPPKISRRGPRNLSIRGNTLACIGGMPPSTSKDASWATRSPTPGALTAAVVIAPTVTAGETGVRISGVRVPAGLASVHDLRAAAPVATPVDSMTPASAGGLSRLSVAAELAGRAGPPR
jgi:hypothetical protein